MHSLVKSWPGLQCSVRVTEDGGERNWQNVMLYWYQLFMVVGILVLYY